MYLTRGLQIDVWFSFGSGGVGVSKTYSILVTNLSFLPNTVRALKQAKGRNKSSVCLSISLGTVFSFISVNDGDRSSTKLAKDSTAPIRRTEPTHPEGENPKIAGANKATLAANNCSLCTGLILGFGFLKIKINARRIIRAP